MCETKREQIEGLALGQEIAQMRETCIWGLRTKGKHMDYRLRVVVNGLGLE